MLKIFRQNPRDTWYPEGRNPTIIQEKSEEKPIWPDQVRGTFHLEGHSYLVADHHGFSLDDLLETTGFSSAPLTARQIQSITKQLFSTTARRCPDFPFETALMYPTVLHDSGFQTERCSIRPGNVVLVNSDFKLEDVTNRSIPSISHLYYNPSITRRQLFLQIRPCS
jgi:hypothetical protein